MQNSMRVRWVHDLWRSSCDVNRERRPTWIKSCWKKLICEFVIQTGRQLPTAQSRRLWEKWTFPPKLNFRNFSPGRNSFIQPLDPAFFEGDFKLKSVYEFNLHVLNRTDLYDWTLKVYQSNKPLNPRISMQLVLTRPDAISTSLGWCCEMRRNVS